VFRAEQPLKALKAPPDALLVQSNSHSCRVRSTSVQLDRQAARPHGGETLLRRFSRFPHLVGHRAAEQQSVLRAAQAIDVRAFERCGRP
jgi:hypothetical protein